MMRSPAFDVVLPPEERRASILLDGFENGVIVEEVELHRGSIKIVTSGGISPFYFDLRKIGDKEYGQLKKHLRYLNYDNTIKLNF